MEHGVCSPAMSARYDIREDVTGWSVYDVWTGQTVVLDDAKQIFTEIQDADDVADLLNYLAAQGELAIRQ
jgi:hypothetical protein